ncbi:uncharacterized protein LOC131167619 [Malania oleifera]|uniref:uncharacterized protein LOC131167619 n=1 Tax=Malania oleifera TaxID=397392 RepID=UPI0025ADAC17|nr:uncharacterized protein LOC131167619 [Malania oleifera]
MNPLAFSGGPNLIAAENLILEIEELLGVLECTEEKKVRFATFKLVGEANRWWRSTKLVEEQQLGYASVTWSYFRKVFFNKYFPITTREVEVEEFMHLTQGFSSVQQYTAQFMELSRFAPHMVLDELKKAPIFERGLKQKIRIQVAMLLVQSFTKLVDRAMATKASATHSFTSRGFVKVCEIEAQSLGIELGVAM